MALYALDGDSLIYAADAKERKTYHCSGCRLPVRVRRGRYRMPHYYHLRTSPSCRLYSKSEDHLLAQLAIQALLPPGEAVIEYPFTDILRVADVLWEPRHLVFEIQCSEFSDEEVLKRTADYQKIGYQIVWILDDRYYNRRRLRPGEVLVRTFPCYYGKLRTKTTPLFYDQFEIFHLDFRFKKGPRLNVHLNTPSHLPDQPWNVDNFPAQVLAKIKAHSLYFRGDLLHRALLSDHIATYLFAMQNLKAIEERSKEELKPPHWSERFLTPFEAWVYELHEWLYRKNRQMNS